MIDLFRHQVPSRAYCICVSNPRVGTRVTGREICDVATPREGIFGQLRRQIRPGSWIALAARRKLVNLLVGRHSLVPFPPRLPGLHFVALAFFCACEVSKPCSSDGRRSRRHHGPGRCGAGDGKTPKRNLTRPAPPRTAVRGSGQHDVATAIHVALEGGTNLLHPCQVAWMQVRVQFLIGA